LRAIEPEDADVFAAADTDTDGARAGGRVWPPRSSWATARWVEEATQASDDSDEVRLAIEALATGEVVGTVKAQDCDVVAGTFGYGIVVFEWARRHGYGGDAVAVLLRYLFGERRYQKCTVGVHAFNEASIAFHRSLGFEVEGRIRRAHFSAGRHWDEVVLGLTVEEFTARWSFDTS
jgi:RimJ/RimL family protein N-acetyltransferase